MNYFKFKVILQSTNVFLQTGQVTYMESLEFNRTITWHSTTDNLKIKNVYFRNI
jgi:hypothetical protein